MALLRATKETIVAQYVELLGRSNGLVLADFNALPVKQMDKLRKAVRDANGGLHATKNTLLTIALRESGMSVPDALLLHSTLAGFCFGDVSPVAKAMLDFGKEKENDTRFSVKGGVMGKTTLSLGEVQAIADLPPLHVLQAQLLGLIQTPATRIASVLSAPGRQVATVLKAYAEKETEAAAPAA